MYRQQVSTTNKKMISNLHTNATYSIAKNYPDYDNAAQEQS